MEYTTIKTICVYKAITNKDCPYCGITTQIKSFKNNEGVVLNKNKGILLYYFAYFEILIRALAILFKKYKNKKIFYGDMIIHGILLSCFFMINIYFICFVQ